MLIISETLVVPDDMRDMSYDFVIFSLKGEIESCQCFFGAKLLVLVS